MQRQGLLCFAGLAPDYAKDQADIYVLNYYRQENSPECIYSERESLSMVNEANRY